jgi:hypothetical protein
LTLNKKILDKANRKALGSAKQREWVHENDKTFYWIEKADRMFWRSGKRLLERRFH